MWLLVPLFLRVTDSTVYRFIYTDIISNQATKIVGELTCRRWDRQPSFKRYPVTDRTMVRSLLPKVRSLHSKVKSLHQISYFGTNISYFASCCKVNYYLPMIFKVYGWWCVLRRFEYIVFTDIHSVLQISHRATDARWWNKL